MRKTSIKGDDKRGVDTANNTNNVNNANKGACLPFCLADVADALKIPRLTAYQEAQKLLEACPVLAPELPHVTADALTDGRRLASCRMTAAGLFALWGWMDTRRASRLFFDVMRPEAGKLLKLATSLTRGVTAL